MSTLERLMLSSIRSGTDWSSGGTEVRHFDGHVQIVLDDCIIAMKGAGESRFTPFVYNKPSAILHSRMRALEGW